MKKFVILFFLLLSSILSLFSSGIIESQDGLQYLAVARDIYYKGEPTAPFNEYNTNRLNIYMSTYTGKNGKTYSSTGLGYSLALLPAVAITDLVYKYYHVSPPIHFPLQSDWLILFLASFTNCLFGAGVGILLFIYFTKINVRFYNAVLLSLVSIFATNLFAYTKDAFAHMMFIFFLLLAFLLVKEYSLTRKKFLLVCSGMSFGICAITYNQTFLLFVLPYIVYYLMLIKPNRLSIDHIKTISTDGVLFFLGILPFALVYIWFENLRAYPSANLASGSFFTTYAGTLLHFPKNVFIEGVYGQLFSSGRSIFIYTPLLLIPILCWDKIKSAIKPELVVFLLSFITYVYFYSTQYVVGSTQQGYLAYWHGESSWGPRYLTPIIPFGMIIVAYIYQQLTKKVRLYLFLPLAAIGLFVELLGVMLPYQIKYAGLDQRFYVNRTEYNYLLYSDLLPRYSPIYIMVKNLARTAYYFPQTLSHGKYNVHFEDGFWFPFSLNHNRFRSIDNFGYLYFDNIKNNPVRSIGLTVTNHSQATDSASIAFTLNHKPQSKGIFLPSETRTFNLKINPNDLLPKSNLLLLTVKQQEPAESGKQSVDISQLAINGTPININSLDYPWISPLGPSMENVTYRNYGGFDVNPWTPWNIHTQITNNTFDFWWIKALYYWDIPKKLFLILLVMNILAILGFGKYTFSTFKAILKKS